MTDDRGQWTSASNAEADLLCPGRYLAQRGLAQPPPSEEADSGTVVHALYTGTKPHRDATPEEIDKADELRLREVQVATEAGFESGKYLRLVEQRLWHSEIPPADLRVQWSQEAFLAHSGRFDVLLFEHARDSKRRAMVLDAKSGWLPVPPPNTNQQLRDLAALVWMHLAPAQVLVNILKPFGRQDPCCIYSPDDLVRAMADLERRVLRSNDPSSPRIAGEVQCRYCRAAHWGKCAQHQSWIGANLPILSPPLPLISAAQWTPEQRAIFCERLTAAGKWLEERKQEIKDLLAKDPSSVPGFGLRDGKNRETITDPQTVFKRFVALGGKLEEFMQCIKVGKGDLKDKVRDLSIQIGDELKGDSLKAAMRDLVKGCTVSTKTAPTIERI